MDREKLTDILSSKIIRSAVRPLATAIAESIASALEEEANRTTSRAKEVAWADHRAVNHGAS